MDQFTKMLEYLKEWTTYEWDSERSIDYLSGGHNGNFDDCFYDGVIQGRAKLAKELLKRFFTGEDKDNG